MKELALNSAIAARARAGEALTEAELLELDASDVLSLGMLADEVRRARVGDTVSFTRVLVAGAGAPPEAVDAALAGADEVRLGAVGTTLDETAASIAAWRGQLGPGRRLTGYSLAEVVAREWGPLDEVLGRLKAAGLDAIADAPVDVVSPEQVARVVAAGLGPRVLSLQRQPADRVPWLLQVRALIQAVPSVRRLAPLSREQSVTVPTTGYHDVRLVALARLALPSMSVIEVDWHQYGPKLAQVALLFGANHLDRVSPVDDAALGPRRATVEEVRRNITAAGFRPAEPGEAA